MLRDEEHYLDYIDYKYDISNKTFDTHCKISNVLNVLCIVGLTGFAHWNNFSFINYIIFILIGFIVFDWICIIIEKIVLSNIGMLNRIRTFFKLRKFKKMNMEEQLKIIKDKQTERKQYKEYNRRDTYYKEELAKIDEELKYYQENLKTIQQEDKMIDDAISRRYLNDISYAEKILATLEIEKGKYSPNIQKKFDKIIKLSNELISICKNEPVLVGQLMKTFNIYLIELVEILSAYSKLDNEEKSANLDKVNLIFEELVKHLEELKDKVQYDSSEKFHSSADLLLTSLREGKEKEDKNV